MHYIYIIYTLWGVLTPIQYWVISENHFGKTMQLWIKSDTPTCLLNFKSLPRIYLLPKCVYFSGIKCISQMLLKTSRSLQRV